MRVSRIEYTTELQPLIDILHIICYISFVIDSLHKELTWQN